MKRLMRVGPGESVVPARRPTFYVPVELPDQEPKTDTQWSRAQPLSQRPDWYAALRERLSAPRTDDDGRAIGPLGAAPFETAKRLIDLLADEPTPRPFMSVLSMDAVSLEWESAGRELTIIVLPDGTLDYARATSSGEVTESHGSFAAQGVREQLRWLRPPV